MGWTFTGRTRDQLIRELTVPQDTERASREVIDHTLHGNVLWSVVRVTARQAGVMNLAAGESACFIACDLLEGSGRGWGYKSLAEAEHPYYYSCPLRYLKMAPQQCAAWRERVQDYHAQRRARGDTNELLAG